MREARRTQPLVIRRQLLPAGTGQQAGEADAAVGAGAVPAAADGEGADRLACNTRA
jgi:hypothetical protein